MADVRNYAKLTRRYAKFSLAGVLALLALVVLVIGGKPESAQAAPVACPKFRVMNNDRIGKVSFPAGYYSVSLLNGNKLTCAQSTKLFQEFLQDWDGKLRRPRPEPRRCPNGAWTVQGRRYRSRWLALASVRSPAEMFMLGTEKLGRRLAGALNRNAKRKIEARDAAGRPYTLELIDDRTDLLELTVETRLPSASMKPQEGADHAAS